MKTKTTKKPAGDTPAATAKPPAANGSVQPASEEVRLVLLDDLLISEHNTRHPKPSEPGIIELALSMDKNGQTTPAIVRPHPRQKGKFEIGAGARRRVAAQVNRWSNLAVVVRELDDTAFEELILVENLQREDPDPKAEVELLDRLVKRGIHTAAQISAHLGKPEHWVARRLQLLKVIPELRKLWATGGERGLDHFSADMMSLVGTLPAETQKMFLDRNAWQFRECESTSELRKYLDQTVLCRLDQAPFDLNDKRFFVKGCGPGCACDSSLLSDLFEQDKKGPARCLNVACFKSRCALAIKARFDEITKGEDLPIVTTEYRGRGDLQIGGKRIQVEDIRYKGLGHPTAKPTPGSIKVLHVGENDVLTVGYLPKRRDSSRKAPKSPGASRAERVKILQGKRWLLVHPQLAKALGESQPEDCVEDIVDLIAVFGLPYHAQDWYGDETWKQFDGRKRAGFPLQAESRGYEYSRRTPKAKGIDKTRAAALWHGLKIVLADVMNPPSRVGNVSKRENVMRRVAALIKFPIDAKKKEADLKILPPRTWGKLDPHTLQPVKSELNAEDERRLRQQAKQLGPIDQKKTSNAPTSNVERGKKAKRAGLTPAMRKKLSAQMKARWAAHRKIAAKK